MAEKELGGISGDIIIELISGSLIIASAVSKLKKIASSSHIPVGRSLPTKSNW